MKPYKVFAIVTLGAAPLVVMLTDGLAPRRHDQPPPPVAAVAPTPAPMNHIAPAPPSPPPAPMESPADPASFSQPLPGAGQPFLAPGSGLPALPSDKPPSGETPPDDSAPPANQI